MKFPLLILFSLITVSGFSQESDMLVLKKKNNRTIETFFAGKITSFALADGQWVKGRIRYIARDTVFMEFYDVRRTPNQFGTFSIDTVGIIPYKFHYGEMAVFPRRNNSWSFIKNGLLMKIAGGGYILLNVINGRYLDEPITSKENLRSLGTAGGVFALGFILGRLYQPYHVIGNRYQLKYISMIR